MLSLIALTNYLLLCSVQLFSSKYKNFLCVFTHFICLQVWNTIVFKLCSFSIEGCFIHINISYRFLSLLEITGMFGSYCSERKYMILHSSAHIICLWTPLDLTYCCSDVFFFRSAFRFILQKATCLNPGLWSLLSAL